MVSENWARAPQPDDAPAESAPALPAAPAPVLCELESVTRWTPAMPRSDVTVRATPAWLFAQPAISIAGAGIAPRSGSVVPSTVAAAVTLRRNGAAPTTRRAGP